MDPAGRIDPATLKNVGSVSASHHDDVTVFGLCGSARIGIDIEPEFEAGWDDALDAVLSDAELATLRQLPTEQQPAAYFGCWTRKEAVMKALGEGLSDRSPSSIEVTMPPEPAALLAIDGVQPAGTWAIATFRPTDGYTGSVAAVDVGGVNLEVHEWPVDLSA